MEIKERIKIESESFVPSEEEYPNPYKNPAEEISFLRLSPALKQMQLKVELKDYKWKVYLEV